MYLTPHQLLNTQLSRLVFLRGTAPAAAASSLFSSFSSSSPSAAFDSSSSFFDGATFTFFVCKISSSN
ncbi:hypothetical protein Hanom_Chr05g00463221 [Helianthus anomalus]